MSDRSFNLSYQISLDQIQNICDQIPDTEKVKQITPMNAGLSAFLVKLEFQNPSTPSWVLRVVNPDGKKRYEQEIGAILQAHQNPTVQILNQSYNLPKDVF